jgi:nesprin-1
VGIVLIFPKVKECCSPLLYEAQQLTVPLEELETQITSFYDSLGKINEILSVLEQEAQSSTLFKQKHQVRKKSLSEISSF